MYYDDCNPPHFHAQYQKDKISVEIQNGKIKGEMSERALKLILEWLDLHRKDLLKAWNQSSNGQKPNKIDLIYISLLHIISQNLAASTFSDRLFNISVLFPKCHKNCVQGLCILPPSYQHFSISAPPD